MSHYSPLPEPNPNASVNPVVVAIGLFFVVGLIFALLYLWLSD